MSLIVNGKAYDWGDVSTKMPGLNLVCQEIDYDDELDIEEVYGTGQKPRGYGEGNYKCSGKITILRDDLDAVTDYCKAKGIAFYKLVIPSLVVSYANDGSRTRSDELRTVKFSKRSFKAAQGDKSIKIDLDFSAFGGVIVDGMQPV